MVAFSLPFVTELPVQRCEGLLIVYHRCLLRSGSLRMWRPRVPHDKVVYGAYAAEERREVVLVGDHAQTVDG